MWVVDRKQRSYLEWPLNLSSRYTTSGCGAVMSKVIYLTCTCSSIFLSSTLPVHLVVERRLGWSPHVKLDRKMKYNLHAP